MISNLVLSWLYFSLGNEGMQGYCDSGHGAARSLAPVCSGQVNTPQTHYADLPVMPTLRRELLAAALPMAGRPT